MTASYEGKGISEFIPSSWLHDPQKERILFRIYRIATVRQSEFPSIGTIIDFKDARAVITSAELQYLAAPPLVAEEGDGFLTLKVSPPSQATRPRGLWLFLVVPHPGGKNESGDVIEVTHPLNAIVGLFAAFCGRNTVYEHVCDQEFSLTNQSISIPSKAVQNPFVFPKPQLERTRIEALVHAAKAIEGLEPNHRNSVTLSLHWHESSIRSHGVDAFIKSWISLEILSMPDTTDIRPINEALARVYGISRQQAAEAFHIGRVFGIRSRIIHNGEIVSIIPELEEYVRAIFIDLLCEHLAIPPLHEASRVLDRSRDVISKCIGIPLN